MLRACSCVIALIALVTCSSRTAQAADTTLTLACQGTTIITALQDAKPEPVSMGIIVNFTKSTVHGFGYPGLSDHPVKITAFNEVTVAFGGSEANLGVTSSISGSIDRVTGDVEATSMMTNTKKEVLFSMSYALKCRPAQRMF